MDSGGASFHAPPPLAARGLTRRRWKLKKNRGSGMFPSPSVLLNRRRPAEQEKKHTPVDFSLLFLDLLKNFCHPFLPVCSASADGRSSGGGLLRRRRRRCYGKETSLQGWRSLLLETGLRVRRSPSSPLFRVADRVCERGAAAGSLMTGGRDDWSWLVCGRCC